MADFEHLTLDTPWPRIPAMRTIENDPLPMMYLNDKTGSDLIARRMPDVLEARASVHRYASMEQSNQQKKESSLLWPVAATKEHLALPFMVAAAAALFTPAYDQGIGIGVTILTSYAAGAVAFYIQTFNEPEVNKKEYNVPPKPPGYKGPVISGHK